MERWPNSGGGKKTTCSDIFYELGNTHFECMQNTHTAHTNSYKNRDKATTKFIRFPNECHRIMREKTQHPHELKWIAWKKNRTAKTCPRLFLARMQNIYMQNACANIEARVCTFLVLKLQWPIFFGVAFNFPHVHSLFLSVVYAYETSGTAPLSHNFVFILGICVFSMHLLSKC